MGRNGTGAQVVEGGSSEPSWPPEPVHVTVDLVLFSLLDGELSVLLWRRPYEPFIGQWALPGTFSRPGETLDESASRALADKFDVAVDAMEQLATYDQPPREGVPGRDPRGRVVSVAYLGLIRRASAASASDLSWWPVAELPDEVAFDHERILADGIGRLRAKARYSVLPFALLAEPFTLSEVQGVYEAVLGETLDVRNFRRDLLGSGAVEETGESRAEGPGRPARLYRLGSDAFAVDAVERRLAEQLRTT